MSWGHSSLVNKEYKTPQDQKPNSQDYLKCNNFEVYEQVHGLTISWEPIFREMRL